MQFALCGLQNGFAPFHMTAGKAPQSGVWLFAALHKQNLRVVYDDGQCPDFWRLNHQDQPALHPLMSTA